MSQFGMSQFGISNLSIFWQFSVNMVEFWKKRVDCGRLLFIQLKILMVVE
jgi:hypothetical protein